MKKSLIISIVFVMMLLVCAPFVSATTNAELPDQLMAIGAKYGATDADKIKIERYLADNPVTDAQANQIVAKAKEAAAVMDAAGVTDVKQLSADKKNQVKAIANEAASVIGVTLSFKNDSVEVYKNGKRVDNIAPVATTGSASTATTTTTSGAKLVYTGSNSYKVLAVCGAIAVVALAAVVGKKVNA